MKLMTQVGAEKLRGGFYTPAPVVDFCLDRISQLSGETTGISFLEPAAGNGAFVRGLGRRSDFAEPWVVCVEVMESEAATCKVELELLDLKGEVVADSFFLWLQRKLQPRFDAVVGNPPYVRYQFVPTEDRLAAESALSRIGHKLQGVSNLWIPFVLLSLELLRPGGSFALVLPAELLATVSAAQIRRFLIQRFRKLQVDLFPRATFKGILQDVLVLSGVRGSEHRKRGNVTFAEHIGSRVNTWSHAIEDSGAPWTRYLLNQNQLAAFESSLLLDGIRPLKEIARIQVSVVTGANTFFTVPFSVVKEYNLAPWARPLLARTEDAPGLIVTASDHSRAQETGKRTWLLDFGPANPDPSMHPGAKRYLASGEDLGLPTRYKCRIRKPWYRVPHIRAGELLMSKRSHLGHRLLLNPNRYLTTDTVYRGAMLPGYSDRAEDLVAGFHNSLTLLAAEIEGRTYGGGVLELVPSEISKLPVPLLPLNGHLASLDHLSRVRGGQRDTDDAIVDATDQLLGDLVPGYSDILADLIDARARLRQRRFGLG